MRRGARGSRVVAVIGGANGIGLEIARQLAAGGDKVAIGDRDGAAANRAAATLGGAPLALQVDVTSPESVQAFLTEVESAWGTVEVLVNSAGVMWVGAFEDEPEAAARAQIGVNLLGVINTVKAVAPAMRRRRSGHLVVIASAASFLTTPGEATYAASKHGVLGYLKAVRTELRGSGVEISVIMPTVVDTALAAGTSSGSAALLQPADVARAVLRTIERPRFEVTIPAYVGPLRRAIEVLPGPARDTLLRALVPDQVRSVDRGARAAYESAFMKRGDA